MNTKDPVQESRDGQRKVYQEKHDALIDKITRLRLRLLKLKVSSRDWIIEVMQRDNSELRERLENLIAEKNFEAENCVIAEARVTELEAELKDIKKVLKLRTCDNDCVPTCLAWIYDAIEEINPCGYHLEEKIRAKYKKKKRVINELCLSRGNLLFLLLELEIIKWYKLILYPVQMSPENRWEKVNDAWKTIMSAEYSTGDSACTLLVARIFQITPRIKGHCEVCDLRTRCENETVEICDPQNTTIPKKMNSELFRKYVENDEGMVLCLIDFDKLREIEDQPGCNIDDLGLVNDFATHASRFHEVKDDDNDVEMNLPGLLFDLQ